MSTSLIVQQSRSEFMNFSLYIRPFILYITTAEKMFSLQLQMLFRTEYIELQILQFDVLYRVPQELLPHIRKTLASWRYYGHECLTMKWDIILSHHVHLTNVRFSRVFYMAVSDHSSQLPIFLFTISLGHSFPESLLISMFSRPLS